jgi:hypothetical protein
MVDSVAAAPTSTGSGDDQPPPPASVSVLESTTLRWAATLIVPVVNSLLHATGLDVKLHTGVITDNAFFQFFEAVLAVVAIWKIFVQRVRAGRDPKNTNVPTVRLPNVLNSLVKQ